MAGHVNGSTKNFAAECAYGARDGLALLESMRLHGAFQLALRIEEIVKAGKFGGYEVGLLGVIADAATNSGYHDANDPGRKVVCRQCDDGVASGAISKEEAGRVMLANGKKRQRARIVGVAQINQRQITSLDT